MIIGFSLIFGLQMIVGWAAKTWFGIAGDNDNIAGIPLIFTVAVYFGGGLVMGLLKENMSWLEPVLVTVLTVAANIILFIIGAVTDLTLISIALSSKSPTLPLLLNFGSVMLAAFAGAFSGARIKIPIDDWISRGAMVVGFISLLVGPYLLLSASGKDRMGLPWYITVIIILALLIIIGFGYVLSTREHNEAEQISINPDHHKAA
ncbi:MAG: hypothetical protein AB1489_16420 [Acidobacteriota bacterium]